MAKKTSSNAIKKVDDQIKNLESKSKKTGTRTVKTSPVTKNTKKSSTTKKTTKTKRDTIIVAPEKKRKKSSSTSKDTENSNVTLKKNSRKTSVKETNKKGTKTRKKRETIQIVVPREPKKEEIIREVLDVVSDEVVNDSRISPPRFVLDDRKLEDDSFKKKEEQLKDYFFVEDEKKISKSEVNLDHVDVSKTEEDTEKKTTQRGKLHKKEELFDTKDLIVDQSDVLDKIDIIDEEKIADEFSQDIPVRVKSEPKKQEFSKKRKGKGYVIQLHKKQSFHELESDLRSLYDKVNDVVEDIDQNVEDKSIYVPKTIPKKKIDFTTILQKIKKNTVKTQKEKVKPLENMIPGERPSLLDHINQKVLNAFLALLFIVFFIMMVAFVVFVIYVSTF